MFRNHQNPIIVPKPPGLKLNSEIAMVGLKLVLLNYRGRRQLIELCTPDVCKPSQIKAHRRLSCRLYCTSLKFANLRNICRIKGTLNIFAYLQITAMKFPQVCLIKFKKSFNRNTVEKGEILG